MKKHALSAFFLFVIFSYNLIPNTAGFRVTGTLLINYQKVILALLVFGLALSKPHKHHQPYDMAILLPLLVLILARFMSIFSASSPLSSFIYWLSTALYWYFFYFAVIRLVRSKQDINQIVKVLVWSGVVVALFNFLEVFTGVYFPALLPGDLLNYVPYERLGLTRAYGLLTDPVATSYYLTVLIPLGLYQFSTSRKRKFSGLLVMIILLAGMMMNFSRASFLAVGVMALVYGIFSRKKLIMLSTVLLCLLLLVVVDNPIRSLFIESVDPTSDRSSGEHYAIYRSLELRQIGLFEVIPAILPNLPLFGYGTGSLVRDSLSDLYQDNVGYLYFGRTEFPAPVVVALEAGLIAGFAFLALLVVSIVKSFRLAKRRGFSSRDPGFYLFLSFIGYLICLSANGVFASLNIFFLLLGIMNVIANLSRVERPGSTIALLPRRDIPAP